MGMYPRQGLRPNLDLLSAYKIYGEDYPLFKTEVRPNAAQHLSNPFAFPSSPKTPDADAKPEDESTGQVEAQSPAAPVSENLESKTSPEDVPSEPSETKAPSEGAAP